MRVAAAAFALAALALVQVPVDSASAPKINGWYPCTDSVARKTTAAPTLFECAEVEVPLCHPGVCTSSKTINVFVKRILAAKPTKPRKALWLLEGGPGYASVGSTLSGRVTALLLYGRSRLTHLSLCMGVCVS